MDSINQLRGSSMLRSISQRSAALVRRVSSRGKRIHYEENERNEKPELKVKPTRALGRSLSEGTKRKTPAPSVQIQLNVRAIPIWGEAGTCWDGREPLQPEIYEAYDSNADFIPAQLRRAHVPRLVYSSTLSSFPVRPPLKTRASSPIPEVIAETEAQQIASNWRNSNSNGQTVTPSYSLSGAESVNGNGSITPTVSDARTPIAINNLARSESESDDESSLRHRESNEDSSTSLESNLIERGKEVKEWVIFN